MKKRNIGNHLFFLITFLMCITNSFAQQSDSCDIYLSTCGDKPCGPVYNKSNRTVIQKESLQQTPYSYIIHQNFNRYTGDYASTGSFIAPNIIITAHHNVKNPINIKGITFINYGTEGEGIYFKKKELKILTYKSSLNTTTDIAVIVFKNPSKVAPIYKGHFTIYNNTAIDSNAEVHLTGFPCDMPDTMMDKKIQGSLLKQHEAVPLWGYDMFTCTGDSGAPLWVSLNGKPTVIGIHHGGNEDFFPKTCLNVSAKIDAGVLAWLNNIIAKYHEQ